MHVDIIEAISFAKELGNDIPLINDVVLEPF